MNNITIKGRLTRDPEVKEYTNKKGEPGSICTISVAVDRRMGEETDFFNCKAFGKRGEVINKYFSKGKEIVVSGSMQCDPYEAKDGGKRYPWSLMIDNFDFCGKKNDSDNSSTAAPANIPDSMESIDEDVPF